jgi:hypothetical protein
VRETVPGSRLNDVALSNRRYPRFKVLLHNPRCTTVSQVAAFTFTRPPLDITAYVELVEYAENIGFENGDDPTTPSITVTLRRHPATGAPIRRGLLDDGVIVQVFTGDRTVEPEDWVCIFTGTFRGRPGDNPGTPADRTEGLVARAHGREERYLNLMLTTTEFPNDTDLGVIANEVAQVHMGLTLDEVLFGAQGVTTKHLTNQLVEINALQALWECVFPVGKKPKFDSLGRLRMVDVSFTKPAARVYAGRALIRQLIASPNEVEVNNSVVMKGLSHVLTKQKSEPQRLLSFEAITGFFDSVYNEDKYYSEDRSQRADDTYLVTTHAIDWSDATWTEVDEFHGRVGIDCHTLFAARLIIFVTYLALQIAVAYLDLVMQSGVPGLTPIITPFGPMTLALWREILYITSIVALAGLLWAMQFIGRGSYEVWGAPFEYVYQELMVRMKLTGLTLPEIREIEYRNDFVSDIDSLTELAYLHLQRELVKNQTVDITIMDDPLLEVDDIIEIDGDRYYITSISKTLVNDGEPLMSLRCWQISSAKTEAMQALETVEAAPS